MKDKAIDVHNHARCLNLANGLCMAWCLEHFFPSYVVKNLKLFVALIVRVKSPVWFEIKIKHSCIEGPYHILKQ